LAARFPQKKIFQDELPIAGRKRSTANPARYFTVNGFRSGFGFDDLIKRVAMGALEMDCRGSDHDMSPCPDVSDAIYFPAPEATNPIVHRGGKRHLGIGQTVGFPQFMHRERWSNAPMGFLN
jgi:hypothetical protein